MKRYGVLAVLVLGTILVTVGTPRARSFEWREVTDADWNVQEDSSKGIRDAAMIFELVREDERELQSDKVFRTIYTRIRILNDEGRDWADVDLVHIHKKQKMESIKGRTILRDGTIIELDPEQVVEKVVVRSKGRKIKQTSFSLPGVTDDCIIEYMVRYKLPAYVPIWYIQKSVPLLHGELTWVIPRWQFAGVSQSEADKYVTPNFLWLNTMARPSVEKLPNIKEPESLLFKIDFVPAFEEEPYTVSDGTLKTKLICYHGTNKDAMAYWGEMATNVNEWMEEFTDDDNKVKKVVEQFEELPTEQEKVEAAYKWIQDQLINISYSDVEDEEGKDVKIKDRNNVNDVLKRGYGNNRQLNYLFCDMLREMNIEAHIAHCRDRFEDLFVSQAKYWQFDNSLVQIQYGDGTVMYASPGHMYTQFGQVPWFVEGTTALVGGGQVSLQSIPFGSFSENTTDRLFHYSVDEDLAVEGDLSMQMRGQAARSLRVYLEDEDSTDFKNLIVDQIDDDLPRVDLELVSYDNLTDCNKPLKLSLTLQQNDLTPVGDKVLLKPFDYCTTTEDPFYAPKRECDVLFDYAETVRESALFDLPENVKVEALPADTVFENGAGKCAVSMQLNGNTLHVQRMFMIKQAYFLVDTYPIIQELFQARQHMAGEVVVLDITDEG